MNAMHVHTPTENELAGALRSLGFDFVHLERRRHAYQSSFPVEELTLSFADGTQLELVFKDLAWDRQGPEALIAKPRFLYNPMREIDVYTNLLANTHLGVRCFGSLVDPQAGRYWLFLERATGIQLHQVGDIVVWQDAARWLARLHTRFSAEADALPRSLLTHDSHYYNRWLRRAIAFQAQRATSPSAHEALQRVATAHDTIVARLESLPRTFLHGEFYSTNILVRPAGDGHGGEVAPIDWEDAAVGPSLTDLAALVSGTWRDEDRLSIVRAYHDALPAEGRPGLGALLDGLAYCRLQLAVQWLGWSETWQPPPEKQHDWLADLIELADRLQLPATGRALPRFGNHSNPGGQP